MKELEVSPTTEPCKGNIHGYILPELLQKLKGENLLNKIPIANMTRDPIGFIESYSCLVIQNAIEYPEKYYLEHLPRAKSNMHLLKIFSKTPESDYEMQGFIEACFMLKKMASDLEYKEIPVIQMEKITTDKAYFKDIFTFLTRGSLELDESRLDKIFEGGRINSHTKIVKKSCKDSRPPNIWMNWSECKKKAFLEIIDPQILRRHISLGYDLSYLIDAKNNL